MLENWRLRMMPDGLQVVSTSTVNQFESVQPTLNDINEHIDRIFPLLMPCCRALSRVHTIPLLSHSGSTSTPFTFLQQPVDGTIHLLDWYLHSLFTAAYECKLCVGSRLAHDNTHILLNSLQMTNCCSILLFLSSLQMKTSQLLGQDLHRTTLVFLTVLHMIILLGLHILIIYRMHVALFVLSLVNTNILAIIIFDWKV